MTVAERQTMIDSWKDLGFIISDRTEKTANDELVYIDLPSHMLPQGEKVIGYVSDKSVNDGKVKFQFSMPVPSSNEEAQAHYGCDLDLIIRTGILGFSRSADDKAKTKLFDGSPPSVEKHSQMQVAFMAWKPGVRERAIVATSTKIAKQLKTDDGFRSMIKMMVEAGRTTLTAANELLVAQEIPILTQEECKSYNL